MKTIIFILCMFTFWTLTAQTIKATKIHYRIIENKIEIFYDLHLNKDSLHISIAFMKKSDIGFSYEPNYIKGDIGDGIFTGAHRKIIWEYTKEPTWVFTGSDFYFRINCNKLHRDITF